MGAGQFNTGFVNPMQNQFMTGMPGAGMGGMGPGMGGMGMGAGMGFGGQFGTNMMGAPGGFGGPGFGGGFGTGMVGGIQPPQPGFAGPN